MHDIVNRVAIETGKANTAAHAPFTMGSLAHQTALNNPGKHQICVNLLGHKVIDSGLPKASSRVAAPIAITGNETAMRVQ
jgi:hypothetical protein